MEVETRVGFIFSDIILADYKDLVIRFISDRGNTSVNRIMIMAQGCPIWSHLTGELHDRNEVIKYIADEFRRRHAVDHTVAHYVEKALEHFQYIHPDPDNSPEIDEEPLHIQHLDESIKSNIKLLATLRALPEGNSKYINQQYGE